MFEDEEYHQWKKWHNFLDRQDELRRHARGIAFKLHAKESAWWALEERRAWEVAWLQKVSRGFVARHIAESGYRKCSVW